MRPLQPNRGLPSEQGLYDPANEHDACDVGFIASIKGERTLDILASGLEILVKLLHPAIEVCREADAAIVPIAAGAHRFRRKDF